MSPVDTPARYLSFDDYLDYDNGSERRYELLETGELIEVPLENQANIALVLALARYLEQFADWRLFRCGNTAIEVSPLTVELSNGQRKRVAQKTRVPDLICFTVEGMRKISDGHKGLALTDENPRLVVEVVSQSNANEDYISKRAQYAARGISEYWLIDRHQNHVIVFTLKDTHYIENVYKHSAVIRSDAFPEITLSAEAILTVDKV